VALNLTWLRARSVRPWRGVDAEMAGSCISAATATTRTSAALRPAQRHCEPGGATLPITTAVAFNGSGVRKKLDRRSISTHNRSNNGNATLNVGGYADAR